jgi:hypothetical protein
MCLETRGFSTLLVKKRNAGVKVHWLGSDIDHMEVLVET